MELIKSGIPTFMMMGLGLSMFSAVICLVLKIFASARYSRTRRYANAHINPPLTVSGNIETFITILKIQIHTFDKKKQFYYKMDSNKLLKLLDFLKALSE